MQASLVSCIASNSAEPSADAIASGQGVKNSALQTQTTDTLFTSILQQGIADNSTAVQLIVNTEDAKKSGQDEAVDVCGLLMQLMVMNSADQSGGNNGGNENVEDKTVNGILGVINEISPAATGVPKGLNNAATVILQNDGKAAEVLSALAASKNTGAPNNAQHNGQSNGNAEKQLDAVLAGIADALKSDLKQNGAVQNGQPAGSDAIISGASENTAISNGINGTANNNGSNPAGQTDDLSAALLSDATAGKVTSDDPAKSGNSAGGNLPSDNPKSAFGEIISREKKDNNDLGAIGNPANQILTETGFKGETLAEKTAAVERALNRLPNDLRGLRSGNQEIRIVLQPESLGVLIISVIKTDSGISAKIKSEDKEVVAIISEHLQKLISSIQSKGITVDDVDVVYSQAEQNTSFTQHSFSQAREESSKGYTYTADKHADAETPGNELWQNYFGGETGSDTTVDYRV